ncbi:MAG TPA: FlgD immunoglobulin-like domain containing protein [Nocardioides sp.]|nr:FlgD immunoglobulin-like domain containing protein [Nocardioides sp.]
MPLGNRNLALAAVVLAVLLAASLQPVNHHVSAPRTTAHAALPAAAPLAVALAHRDRFYPRVQDGWRDRVRLGWRVDPGYGPWSGEAAVLRRGEEVGRYALGENPTVFRWDGLDDAGDPLPKGHYQVRVGLRLGPVSLLTGVPGSVVLTYPVRIATRTVSRTETVTVRPADQDLRDVRVRGLCAVSSERTGALLLGCRYGGYLQAGLPISVPADAVIESTQESGRVRCCWPGLVRTFWTRPDPTTVVLGIRVTGNRRYRLRGAEVTYTASLRR